MAKIKVEDIRNVVLCGHGSCGKTTLADRFLTLTGTVTRQLSVDDGSSVCDFDDDEKARKHSIESAVTHFTHGGLNYNVIDTPGKPDFIGQAIGAMRGVDTAAIVINAQAGIEVNTRRVFNEAGTVGLGRIIVINRMDADNIEFDTLIDGIQEMFGAQCALFNVPVGQGADFKGVVSTLNVPDDTAGALMDPAEIQETLIESIVEADDETMEKYLEGEMPTEEQLSKLIVQAVAQGTLIPIVCCSSKTGVGVEEVIDALGMCGLDPTVIDRTAKNADGEEVAVTADPEGPLVAQVFKTRIDPFVQKLSFIRVFSGTIAKDSNVPVVGVRKGIKVAALLKMQGSETTPVDSAGPGEIVAIAKVEELETNTTLGALTMPGIIFPMPMVGLAVTPKSRSDQTKLSGALAKLKAEDPTFRIDRDQQTKETVIMGISDLHLLILQERLKARDKVEVDTKIPKVPYRETVQKNAEGSYRHKKQSGGSGQFGEVHIRLYPFPGDQEPDEFIEAMQAQGLMPNFKQKHYFEDSHMMWIDSIVGGVISSNFFPAIEKGFLERADQGVIAGYKIQNICIELHFGKMHPVDSNETAFKMAASIALRNVFREAAPALLEPIVRAEITVPDANVGDITGDMSNRRGRVLEMGSAGGDLTMLTAEVPLAEMTTYNRVLAAVTGGQGSYTIELSHYDIVPGNVQQEIIAAAKLEEEED